MLDFIFKLSFTIAEIFLILFPFYIFKKIDSILKNNWTFLCKIISSCTLILIYILVLVFVISKDEIEWSISRKQSKEYSYTVVSDAQIVHKTGCVYIPSKGHIYGSNTLDYCDEEFGYSFCPKCKPNKNQKLYIGNKSNNRIHKKDCSYLPFNENCIYFDSICEAETAGYQIKCDHCFIYD